MRVKSVRSQRVLGALVVLVLLLASAWPAAVQGQGPQPGDGAIAPLERRLREPDAVPRYSVGAPTGAGGPQGLRLWDIVPVDYNSGEDTGAAASLALDASGRLHISYNVRNMGPNGESLRYAYNDGASWQKETVDSSVGAGQYTSLVLDGGGSPHIAYFVGGAGTLRYASWTGTAWVTETVDSDSTVGQYCSLALDSADRPHISYYDVSNAHLKYAYYDGSAWHTETVDGSGDTGKWGTSLALDAAGWPHISYCFNTYGNCDDLRYAWYDGMAWNVVTLETTGQTGIGSSLRLDAGGWPHIAYTNWDGQLRYAHWNGSTWLFERIGADNAAGPPSLILDGAGRPCVAYGSSGNYVYYAAYDGASWRVDLVGLAYTEITSLQLDAASRPSIAYRAGSYGDGELRYAAYVGNVGDWSRLAFGSYRDMNWEVYAARGDGAYPVRLTNNSAADSRPELNRGATQIVFDSRRSGNYDIWKMNADGSGLVRLTTYSYNEYLPTWSPDGSRIAFYGFPDTQTNGEVYVMNADSSNLARLTSNPAFDGHPTWSPDGTRIAFVSNRSGAYDLWAMNADGSNVQQLTQGLSYAAYPDWSPDGTRFVLNDDYSGDGWFDLAVINADGTGLTHPLGASPGLYDRLAPTWAPTGQDVAFSLIQYIFYQGQWYWVDAYVYGLDLSNNSTYLLLDSGFDWWPDWQPADAWAPETQVWTLPPWSGSDFAVSWGGWDPGGAGLKSYDVQYRDGDGPWTDWVLDTTQTAATFSAGQDGHTYSFRSRGRDYAFNVEAYPDAADAWTTVDTSPPASSAWSPPYAAGTAFGVSWTGTDAGSGVASYDVQYRDGGGAWTNWQVDTTNTSATFVGAPGHTYYFQSRARDLLGNEESYPGGDGDTHTRVLLYALLGYVLNTVEEPVALALVAATPPLSNTAYTLVDGSFTLYGDVSGTYTVSVTRGGFGALPPMSGVAVPGATPVFYLPPLDERVVDGGFEAGDLAAWSPAGDVAPVLTSTAHTGSWAAAFGGVVPPPVVTPTAAFSTSALITASGGLLTSTVAEVAVPAGGVSGTAVFTLSGIPTVTLLPAGVQDVGLHVEVAAALTDGTPLTATLYTLTVHYEDAAWRAAQVAAEETLALWRFDPVSTTWVPLSGTLDVLSNTVTVTATWPGRFALLGTPYSGPWSGVLAQDLVLTPTLASATLSLLYRVEGAQVPTDTLLLALVGPTQTVTYTLPLTVSGWVHRWWEVPLSPGPTPTLRVEWSQGNRDGAARVIMDEISLGPVAAGAYGIYLPVVIK